jgi:hypothetical protein
MLTLDATLDQSIPYDPEKVIKAAQVIWNPKKFYDEGDEFEEEEEEGVSEWESAEEEEFQVLKKKKKKKPKAKAPVPERPARTTTTSGTATPNTSSTDDVAELIDKLGRLSLEDPAYAALYFLITTKAPSTTEWLAKPVRKEAKAQSFGTNNTSTTVTATNSNSNSSAPSPTSNSQRSNRPLTCFGCGEDGHTTTRCKKCDDLIKQGVIKRDETNKIVWADGSPIRRYSDENILEAVQRTLAAKPAASGSANFIQGYSFQGSPSYLIHESEDEAEEDDGLAFPATRARPAGKETRRQQVLDGVYPPPLSKAKKRAQDAQTFNPVEVQAPQFNPDDDDAFMEDAPQTRTVPVPVSRPPKATPSQPRPVNEVPSQNPKVSKPAAETPAQQAPAQKNGQEVPTLSQPRSMSQSELQRRFNSQQLMDKFLQTPITISIQELLGGSSQFSKAMIEMLKITRVPKDITATAYHIEQDNSQLICIRCQFDNGEVADTIVDTGSQLNVMDRSIANISGMPINKTKQMIMRDAGHGSTQMDGQINNLSIRVGQVETKADVWVGKVPFRLLLGRPWQRSNRVSIDEREDGSWLIFRDFKTGAKFELNAVPCKDEGDWTHYMDERYYRPQIDRDFLHTILEEEGEKN